MWLGIFGEPQAYAEPIEDLQAVRRTAACVHVGGARSNIKKRMESMMINRLGLRLNVTRQAALALAATVALSAPIVVGVLPAPLKAQSRPRTSDSSS